MNLKNNYYFLKCFSTIIFLSPICYTTLLEKRMQHAIIRDIDIVIQANQSPQETDNHSIFTKAKGTGDGTWESPMDSNKPATVHALLTSHPGYQHYNLDSGKKTPGPLKIKDLLLHCQ